MPRTRIGVDIGGSGVKAGVVDVDVGALVGERLRVETPRVPDAVVAATAELIEQLGGDEVVGIGFPAIILDGVVCSANNIDQAWIGVDAVGIFENATGRKVRIINDADAAALAEGSFGSARDVAGTVVVLTFGTGIGSGVLLDGKLMQNVELGMLELGGVFPAELKYSAKARRREDLTWEEWGSRANEFLSHVNQVFSPTRIVFGGGVSRKWGRFSAQIDPNLPVVPAALVNNAGMIGAAALAL